MQSTRRNFIAIAGAAAPMLLGADDKAGTKAPVVGEGGFKYEVIHDWGELPHHIKYGNTHGVCEDSQGNIYIHHTVGASSESNDTIVVFDSKGKFVRSWGKQFKAGAHGLHINKEGKDEFLYICDQLHGIVTKRTLKGEEVWTLGYPAESGAVKCKVLVLSGADDPSVPPKQVEAFEDEMRKAGADWQFVAFGGAVGRRHRTPHGRANRGAPSARMVFLVPLFP